MTTDAAAASACELISGRQYRSVRELPLGENREGPVYGHWMLSFGADGSVTWRLHDYSDHGPYSCENLIVHATFAPNTPVELKEDGEYEPTSRVLTFAAEAYELAP